MNDYSELERELDLKDLMYWALKRWRTILAGAVIRNRSITTRLAKAPEK